MNLFIDHYGPPLFIANLTREPLRSDEMNERRNCFFGTAIFPFGSEKENLEIKRVPASTAAPHRSGGVNRTGPDRKPEAWNAFKTKCACLRGESAVQNRAKLSYVIICSLNNELFWIYLKYSSYRKPKKTVFLYDNYAFTVKPSTDGINTLRPSQVYGPGKCFHRADWFRNNPFSSTTSHSTLQLRKFHPKNTANQISIRPRTSDQLVRHPSRNTAGLNFAHDRPKSTPMMICHYLFSSHCAIFCSLPPSARGPISLEIIS